ncbi:hypothetical protein GTGU_00170 [Trabulsiella guamensis ATCC 49490]|uniref:DUF2190 family protein n=1 Tax=Trabulsiella guamensis ATCC 49490 TaxID=1005994 RepID=A0A085ASD3_9ENTR|nr:capsid cement protein [Trabulsiella guamensis]KFC13128.1 hypothetical protein GTGU_00170 [Trabulsiella guamensis ATCC 49490]
MATNYQQDGYTMDFTNTGTAAILSGAPVVVGGVVGVAHGDIPVDSSGVLHMAGVFVLPKASEAIAAGTKLYINNGKVTATAPTNPAVAGTAWETVTVDAKAVAVRLGF